MDSITQAALGGVVGELVLGRKIGWKGMAWGVFFGTLPDLDILAYPWLDDAERLQWHRGISHSVLMMVVASFVFAKPLSALHREEGVSFRRAAWFVFLVWSTHVLIDVFTSYGTQVFEPFSDQRVAFNNLFIIDLFFTLPLLVCLFYRLWVGGVSLKRRSEESTEDDEEETEEPEFSLRWAKVAIALSCLYVVFSFVMKLWATDQMKGQMADEIPNARLVMTAPTPFNALLWRGLIETEKSYYVTYWSPFDDEPATYDYLPKQRELAEKFEGKKMFETLKWFSRGHWVARSGEDGKVTFNDVRFGELRNTETNQLLPMFQWQMSFDDDGKMKAERYRPGDIDKSKAVGLILERIGGEQERWQSMEPF